MKCPLCIDSGIAGQVFICALSYDGVLIHKYSDCARCRGTGTVPTKPHEPHWSRKSINEVECKLCKRSGPYSLQLSTELCPGEEILE